MDKNTTCINLWIITKFMYALEDHIKSKNRNFQLMLNDRKHNLFHLKKIQISSTQQKTINFVIIKKILRNTHGLFCFKNCKIKYITFSQSIFLCPLGKLSLMIFTE